MKKHRYNLRVRKYGGIFTKTKTALEQHRIRSKIAKIIPTNSTGLVDRAVTTIFSREIQRTMEIRVIGARNLETARDLTTEYDDTYDRIDNATKELRRQTDEDLAELRDLRREILNAQTLPEKYEKIAEAIEAYEYVFTQNFEEGHQLFRLSQGIALSDYARNRIDYIGMEVQERIKATIFRNEGRISNGM